MQPQSLSKYHSGKMLVATSLVFTVAATKPCHGDKTCWDFGTP